MMENNSSECATETTTSNAAPAPVSVILERRIYTFHKTYGTCITVGARVFLAPAALQFEKKIVYRGKFRTIEGGVLDENGNVWVDGGENGGCGPRCPASLKDKYGKTWHSLLKSERAEILKLLATPAAPATA
jgi:hypothetical protein